MNQVEENKDDVVVLMSLLKDKEYVKKEFSIEEFLHVNKIQQKLN